MQPDDRVYIFQNKSFFSECSTGSLKYENAS